MSNKLAGKVGIVTGSSTGIGAAIAKALASEGASVVVNYNSNQANGEAVVAAITEAGGKAIAFGGDLSKKENAEGIVKTAIQTFGKLDILVNNAGTSEFVSIENFSEDIYHKTFDTNVLAPFLVTSAAVRHLTEGASIINISSAAVQWAPPQSSVYAASKAAIDVFTTVLSKELGPRKIRVNAIKPGTIVTEKVEMYWEHAKDYLNSLLEQTPIGNLGKPDDIGKTAVFLASDDAAFITGVHLSVSGGFNAV